MAVEFALHEARVRYPASVIESDFTAGNNAAWNVGTATKIRAWNERVALTGLEERRDRSGEVRTRHRANPLGIIKPQTGQFTIKVPLNSDAGTGEAAIRTLLTNILLGSSNPTTFQAELDTGGHTTSNLVSAGIGAKLAGGRGHAVLCGARNDGRGDGRVHTIQAKATNDIDLEMATAALMVNTDKIWLSYTVFPDPTATLNAMEWLFIGKSGKALNCIGCQCTGLTLEGLNVTDGGEALLVLQFGVAKWRWEPDATLPTMATTTRPSGPNPVQTRGEGAFLIGNAGYATPGAAHGHLVGGDWSIDPGLAHQMVKGPLGPNGITKYKYKVGEAKWSCKALIDEGSPVPVQQYVTDWLNGTEKQVVLQVGHVPPCFAIQCSRTYFDRNPAVDEYDACESVLLEGHTHEDESQAEGGLSAADIRFHFFHSSD